VIVVLSIGVMLTPEPLENLGGIRNPFGLEGQPWVWNAGIALVPLLLGCMLASALSLVMRYRRSEGEEREQIKWIAFAASVVGLLYLIAMVASFIFPYKTWFTAGLPLWLDLIEYAALMSFMTVPIAVGFAVLKHRLYDLDLLINRTLLYGSLTVMLAGIYSGGVVLLQRIFVVLSGQESTLAVVASTLAIAALFRPLRRRTQSFIDGRFYRQKYDARKALEAFSTKLRDETDLQKLGAHFVGAVGEAMQPAHASPWLRPTRDRRAKEEAASSPSIEPTSHR
jgi:hypothetical protein